tara:strand:+ start:201 stop:530 length:330 start_codon:yes stop_codon:yes gene_type:complete
VNKSPHVISVLLDEKSSISSLYKKAKSFHKIDQKLKEHLNITPTSQFQLSAINDDVATIVVDSSSWATRLRYNIPKILTILNKKLGYPSIKTIRIKIKKNIALLNNTEL